MPDWVFVPAALIFLALVVAVGLLIRRFWRESAAEEALEKERLAKKAAKKNGKAAKSRGPVAGVKKSPSGSGLKKSPNPNSNKNK